MNDLPVLAELVTFVLASPNDGELILFVVRDELLAPVAVLDTVVDLKIFYILFKSQFYS